VAVDGEVGAEGGEGEADLAEGVAEVGRGAVGLAEGEEVGVGGRDGVVARGDGHVFGLSSDEVVFGVVVVGYTYGTVPAAGAPGNARRP
jgi:hypothetical protein